MNCEKSPTGEHGYQLDQYNRDDQGFWLDCVYCQKTAFFDCNSEDELYDRFGINDDYDYEEEE